jgi:hypothetical protein
VLKHSPPAPAPFFIIRIVELSNGTIEQKYYATGPWTVTDVIAAAFCDSSGNKFDLYILQISEQMGSSTPYSLGEMEPVLSRVITLFARLYGLLGLVATEDKNTGAGQTILDGAKFLSNANNDPTSISSTSSTWPK